MEQQGPPKRQSRDFGDMDYNQRRYIHQLQKRDFFSYLYKAFRFIVEGELVWVSLLDCRYLQCDLIAQSSWYLLTLREKRRYSNRFWGLRAIQWLCEVWPFLLEEEWWVGPLWVREGRVVSQNCFGNICKASLWGGWTPLNFFRQVKWAQAVCAVFQWNLCLPFIHISKCCLFCGNRGRERVPLTMKS